MKEIFRSSWFYEAENIGNKICSPVELIVRLKRIVDLQFGDDTDLLRLQKTLGQVLFFPPNVAGWKGGPAWIDSSTLMLRLSLAQAMLHKGRISFRPKPEFEDKPEETASDAGVKFISDWSLFTNQYRPAAGTEWKERLTEFLIQCNPARMEPIATYPENGPAGPEDQVIHTAAFLMSTPEFQLI
jgi:hypothetical protein